jgi:hypothetical protein
LKVYVSEEQGVQGRFKVCYLGNYYGRFNDNQQLLGTQLAQCRPPIYLRLTCTLAHFGYRCPLSSPAHTTSSSTVAHCPCWPIPPCTLLPILLTAPYTLLSWSLTHLYRFIPPHPLSLLRPVSVSCVHPLSSLVHTLPVLSSSKQM